MSYTLKYNAPTILTFSFICIGLQILNDFSSGASNDTLMSHFPICVLFSPLLHIDWEHLLGNFSLLLLIGPMLEEKYGSKRMLVLIVLTSAVTTGLCWLCGQTVIGASGIVFAMVLLASFSNFRHKEIPITFVLIGVIYIFREIREGVTVVDNISHLGHIIGGCVGGLLGFSSYFREGTESPEEPKPPETWKA